MCVKVPDWARARDVRVDIRRLGVSVSVAAAAAGRTHDTDSGGGGGGSKNETAASATVLLEGALSRPVQVDECLWTMETAGRVLLYLHKELPADCEPGFEWWASVLEGDSEVDVLTCDAGSDASKYPEHAKRRGARALWEHQNKSAEEKLKEVCCCSGGRSFPRSSCRKTEVLCVRVCDVPLRWKFVGWLWYVR